MLYCSKWVIDHATKGWCAILHSNTVLYPKIRFKLCHELADVLLQPIKHFFGNEPQPCAFINVSQQVECTVIKCYIHNVSKDVWSVSYKLSVKVTINACKQQPLLVGSFTNRLLSFQASGYNLFVVLFSWQRLLQTCHELGQRPYSK